MIDADLHVDPIAEVFRLGERGEETTEGSGMERGQDTEFQTVGLLRFCRRGAVSRRRLQESWQRRFLDENALLLQEVLRVVVTARCRGWCDGVETPLLPSLLLLLRSHAMRGAVHWDRRRSRRHREAGACAASRVVDDDRLDASQLWLMLLKKADPIREQERREKTLLERRRRFRSSAEGRAAADRGGRVETLFEGSLRSEGLSVVVETGLNCAFT